MKFAVVLAIVAILAAPVARAGDSYKSNPCKSKGMFSANTGDVTKFVRAAGLVPYIEFGACLYRLYLDGPAPKPDAGNLLLSSISPLGGGGIGNIGDILAGIGRLPVDEICKIRDIELNYLCVGTPYDAYPKLPPPARKLLGDDDYGYNKGNTFPPFTRIALSLTVKAKILSKPSGVAPAQTIPDGSWTSDRFNIDLCYDIERIGEFGLPGDIEPCGQLWQPGPAP